MGSETKNMVFGPKPSTPILQYSNLTALFQKLA